MSENGCKENVKYCEKSCFEVLRVIIIIIITIIIIIISVILNSLRYVGSYYCLQNYFELLVVKEI